MEIFDIEKKFLYSLGIIVPDLSGQSLSSIVLRDDGYIEMPYIGPCICNNIECDAWKNIRCSVYIGKNYIKVTKHTRIYELKILRKEDGTLIVRYSDRFFGEQHLWVNFVQQKLEDNLLTMDINLERQASRFKRSITCSKDGVFTQTIDTVGRTTPDPNKYSNVERIFTFPLECPVSLIEFMKYLGPALYKEAKEMFDNNEEPLDTNQTGNISEENIQIPSIWGVKVIRPMSR